MIAAICKETFANEKRVAVIPQDVPALLKSGLEVALQRDAGAGALHPDPEFEARGVKLEDDRRRLFSAADILLMVRGPGADPDFPSSDLDGCASGTILIGFLEPLAHPEALRDLAERGLTAFSMELIPRITRAQSMDALSSMANIAGYRAVILAAETVGKMFPMMMTAAGTITPAKVFVLGAGVAGLQAIATARRLGAVVEAYDVRPAVKEQVESLGGRFVELDLDTGQAEASSGYAKEQSEEFLRRQRELLTERLRDSDVIITTALVPGKKAPVLLTREMVEALRPGGVVVDLAAEKGGNCEVTQPGAAVDHHGVTILGTINLPSDVPVHASQMYSKNITTFLGHLVKDGELKVDLEDEITKATLVTHEGKVVHPAVLKALEDA